MHWMTYEYFGGRFHCGKPWDAYGITYALPGLRGDRRPAGGTARRVQNFLNYGNPRPAARHARLPEADRDQEPNNLTYEGTYWRWVQRAWLGGLRLMVMSINENRVLCTLQANRRTDCDEMDDRPPRPRRHPPAAGLRRRAGRRAGQGLLPDRHRPVRRRGA